MPPKREFLRGVVNRINLIGVELEGGWDVAPKAVKIEHDGSVSFGRPMEEVYFDEARQRHLMRVVEPVNVPKIVGEAVMRPAMKPTEFEPWVQMAYPQHVNETCGLHVHMSFHNKLNYSRLMTEEYMQAMIRELRSWGEQNNIPKEHMLWNRLDPSHPWTNQHCAHLFLGDRQSIVTKKDYSSRGKAHSRYTFINYCEAQHHTVECRGLPMFATAEQAISAIYCVLDTTNRFLSKMRQRERAVRAEALIPPPVTETIGRVVI